MSETYLGLDENPALGIDGYATIKMIYDARGKQIGGNYLGTSGEPVISKKNGYHGWTVEYDEEGNKTIENYLGTDGKPMIAPEGYATIKMSYDSRGNRVQIAVLRRPR